MGYIVKYYYHPLTNGEYDKSIKNEATINVGDTFEDTSLDVLAGKVMSLMARRNIFVSNVEIHEIVKKPVSFKEFDDGIQIKNRKFKFDDTPVITGQNVEAEQVVIPAVIAPVVVPEVKIVQEANPIAQEAPPQNVSAKGDGFPGVKPAADPNAVLRYEYFFPEGKIWLDITKKNNPNIKFTEGKRYPIFGEKVRQLAGRPALNYITVDDRNERVEVTEKLFSQTIPKLSYGQQFGEDDNIKLSYGEESNQMPALRRRSI